LNDKVKWLRTWKYHERGSGNRLFVLFPMLQNVRTFATWKVTNL